MKSNGVIFLKDWKLLISSLTPENQLVFWDLFTSYEYGIKNTCENAYVFPIWTFIKSQLDNMKEKYDEKIVSRNQSNGSKGGRPKKEAENEVKNPKNPVGLNETQKTLNNNNNNNNKDNNNNNDINTSKEVCDLEDVANARKIIKDFNFNETANIDKLRIVTAFLIKQKCSGRLEHFLAQHEAYFAYKKISGEKSHNFTSYFGNQASAFEDGKWDDANWTEKILMLESKTVQPPTEKFDKLVTAHSQLKNPYKK